MGYLGAGGDPLGDFLPYLLRGFEGAKGRHVTQPSRIKTGSQVSQDPLFLKAFQAGEDFFFGKGKFLPQKGKRPWDQRQFLLEEIQQFLVFGVEGHWISIFKIS